MPTTDFKPSFDGLAESEMPALSPDQAEEVHRIYSRAINRTCAQLQPFMGDALVQGIQQKLEQWLARESSTTCDYSGGMVCATLDCYTAGVASPSYVAHGHSSRRSKTTRRIWHAYLWRRTRDNLEHNASTFLSWLAVLYGLPRKSLVEAALHLSFAQALEQTGAVVDPQVRLHVQYPDQLAWQDMALQQQWHALQQHLDAGTPWPITLVRKTRNPYAAQHALAYGYETISDHEGMIYVYEPTYPGHEWRLHLDLQEKRLTEPDTSATTNRVPIVGFYCEAYCLCRPPTTLIYCFLSFLLYWEPVWRMIRYVRLVLAHQMPMDAQVMMSFSIWVMVTAIFLFGVGLLLGRLTHYFF